MFAGLGKLHLDLLGEGALLVGGQAAGSQRRQGGDEFANLDLVALPVIADQLAQLVESHQENADNFRSGDHLPGADQV